MTRDVIAGDVAARDNLIMPTRDDDEDDSSERSDDDDDEVDDDVLVEARASSTATTSGMTRAQYMSDVARQLKEVWFDFVNIFLFIMKLTRCFFVLLFCIQLNKTFFYYYSRSMLKTKRRRRDACANSAQSAKRSNLARCC